MNENTPIPAEDRFAAASHSADVAEGLAILARRHGLTTLGFLLDMAKMEADNVKNSPSP